jgi:Tfp pilus assembly protein PilO
MKLSKLGLPEKVFGVEVALLIVFLPVVVVSVLMVISLNVVVFPKIKEINQVNKTLKSLEVKKKDVVDKRNYLLSIDQLELKKNTDYISNALLPQNNGYVLVELVRKLADKYGFQVESFSIKPGDLTKDENSQPVTNKSGVAKLPIKLNVVGPAKNYLSLVNGIENSLPILSLDSLEMKNTTDVSIMDLSISAYYIEDKTKFEIDKLTLSDLTMNKEESDLISRLNTFSVLEDASILESQLNTKKEFIKYDRKDPFNF